MTRTRLYGICAGSFLACNAPGGAREQASLDGSSVTGVVTLGDAPLDKLDLAGPDGRTDDCTDGRVGDVNLIWIANSGEGTVSKIDAISALELARYRAGPGDPDPSRTSVNRRGDVAVANRAGSVTKIAAHLADCVDEDGDGTIDTSQGPGDVREWGTDECVVWHHSLDFEPGGPNNTGGPRGIAWDRGSVEACSADARVWVSWREPKTSTVKVRRLDGASGAAKATVHVQDWSCEWDHGPYGAAVDQLGAYWALGTRLTLLRVEPETLKHERFKGPVGPIVYGIAIDARGNPWLSGWAGELWRFDVETEQFHDMGGFPGGPRRLRGLAIDAAGSAWIAGNDPCALARFDTVAGKVISASIDLPGCGEPVGVSIDRQGFVWVVDRAMDRAYKVDPDGYHTVVVGGLVAPYTYSDMTGHFLEFSTNTP